MLKNEQASRSLLLGTYERDVQDAICQYVRPGDVFWDIGANLGFFTLLAARLTGGENVLAVEPIPDNISYIQASLDLNPGWTRNVRDYSGCCCRSNGESNSGP
jgi:predicted RNA methylase